MAARAVVGSDGGDGTDRVHGGVAAAFSEYTAPQVGQRGHGCGAQVASSTLAARASAASSSSASSDSTDAWSRPITRDTPSSA